MPLAKMLNPQHSLYLLAETINWQVFDEQFGPLYADRVGRPALSTRLTVALHYIKHLYNLSDDLLLAGFSETLTGSSSVEWSTSNIICRVILRASSNGANVSGPLALSSC
jgi:hypothetical protein